MNASGAGQVFPAAEQGLRFQARLRSQDDLVDMIAENPYLFTDETEQIILNQGRRPVSAIAPETAGPAVIAANSWVISPHKWRR